MTVHEPHKPQHLSIRVNERESVSGLLVAPDDAEACFIFAHGAGAGMSHPFMAATAEGLYERRVATFRYQFPYMEKGLRRPDGPPLAHATVRAAVNEANQLLPDLALFAGGKSFGGRMTSQAQAESALPRVRGIAFLGFPLHAAKMPSIIRARHLFDVGIPMLFLQGSRDALADSGLIQQVATELGDRALLTMFADADHSFHVPARSGRTNNKVLSDVLDALAGWITQMTGAR